MKQYIIKEVNKNEATEIKIGENDLFRIYSVFKNKELEERIDSIIKVCIPKGEEEAKDMLLNGYEFEGNKYVSLLTTVGMMKHEDMEKDYSAEYFFIREEEKEFINALEDIASLGKLSEKYGKELCINKDIISRLSLLMSTGERVHLPNLKKAILPEMTYTYINNYLQFAENDDKTIDLNDLRLKEHKNLEVEHTAMDGSGFIMPHVMKDIQRQLKVNYPLSWIGIREVGVASKGLLVKFDFKKYLKEEHGLDKLTVRDMWGNDVDLMQVDVIQNETQVKWGKWFKSLEEIEQLKLKYPKYKKILNGFNITKINKKESAEYTESNYQILSNLALSPNQLNEIAKEHEEIFEKVIKRDIDATRIMLGDIVREENDELSPSTKIHRLLQLNDSFINIQTAKKTVESMVNKKINTLAGGSVYVKGSYKVILKDAISYMDSLVNVEYKNDGKIVGKISINGLDDNTNYIPKETGNRTLARCPLNSATEIVKTTLSEKKLYKKYFGELSDDIMFFPFNDFMMRMSGADEDLDIALAIDNDIVYNAVIEDIDDDGIKWCFRNQFDGGQDKVIFTKKNMIENILSVRGNAIGRLSNMGAIISNIIQDLPYYEKDWEIYRSYEDVRSGVTNRVNNLRINEKQKSEKIKEAMAKWKEDYKKEIERKNFIPHEELSDKEITDYFRLSFQKHKIYSFFLTYLQMVAIDQPKTNIKVTKDMEEPLKNILKGKKKPLYIYYAKYKKENKTVQYDDVRWSNTLLNNYANKIIKKYGSKARELEEKEYRNDSLFTAMQKVSAEKNDSLIKELINLETEYHSLRNNIKETISIKELREDLKDKTDIEEINKLKDQISVLENKRKVSLKEIDVIIADKYNTIIAQKYNAKEIIKNIAEARKNNNEKICSRFIIQFAFDQLEKCLIEQNLGIGTAYQKDEKGDIRYLYNNYSKINTKLKELELGKEELLKTKMKLGAIKKIRIGGYKGQVVTDRLVVKENGNNLCLIRDVDGIELGYSFPEFKAELEIGQVIEVKEIEKSKNGKTITIYY